MYALAERRWKLPVAWRQLIPRCGKRGCTTGTNWTGVLHRIAGFWVNERDWFCSSRCLEAAMEEHLLDRFFEDHRPAPIRTTMPMGLMMLARGIVSETQLRDALEMQRNSGEKIGACLQRLGSVSYDDIASVVATQWGCPVFPSESVQPGCSMLLPLSLIERYRMLPVHLVSQGRRLFVAFSDEVNHSALISVEQMLGCDTEPCIIPEPKLAQVLEYRKRDTTGEVTVSRPKTAAETSRIIRSYAQQTGAHAIRLEAMDGNIWVRFLASRFHLDLVFEASAH
ncbi:MAG TPA: hypothetical protein VM578_06520 [Candidatus Saccharimonadales bacterium]|nr:hypothetical protein [Candidatus Saccharimonadales bacterium]